MTRSWVLGLEGRSLVPRVRSRARLIHLTLGGARISFVLKSQLPWSWAGIHFILKPQPLWSWAADS